MKLHFFLVNKREASLSLHKLQLQIYYKQEDWPYVTQINNNTITRDPKYIWICILIDAGKNNKKAFISKKPCADVFLSNQLREFMWISILQNGH